ncbi:MAG: DUF4835 family protein [Bacteroidia bacterium]|nr:DUF4835 family protein [Bacteroidia bacterium]
MYKSVLFLFSFLVSVSLSAQELNCTVQIESQQIQSSDKQVFKTLRQVVTEFMNNKKWTNDVIKNNERIECTIVITISDWDKVDQFAATAIIQSSRPIYGSTYSSPILNFKDKYWDFRYLEHQALEFSESEFTTNLTSLLAFYAYLIIGLDYDTFSPEGGTPYLQKAQTVVDNAQNTNRSGWKPYENSENRYWIIENLLNSDFKPMRNLFYSYHRKGFDEIKENDMEKSRKVITAGLKKLKIVKNKYPNSFLMRLFFIAKADELVDFYTKATPVEKSAIANLLGDLDPSNSIKYQGLKKK